MIDIFQGTAAPLSVAGFAAAALALGTAADAASLWALIAVETRGFGYLPDRRPKILFERHVFHAGTSGRFDAAYPDISNKLPGGYGLDGAPQYQRLKRAMLLDRTAALQSASWGLAQVMGFNAGRLGYGTVDAMIASFKASEDDQLIGCAKFILANPPLHDAFRARNWGLVAFYYNGKTYRENDYDTKLATNYADFTGAEGTPDIGIRADQARLSYLGYDPHGVDGKIGDGTRAAVSRFQRSYVPPGNGTKLAVNGLLDEPTRSALARQAGL